MTSGLFFIKDTGNNTYVRFTEEDDNKIIGGRFELVENPLDATRFNKSECTLILSVIKYYSAKHHRFMCIRKDEIINNLKHTISNKNLAVAELQLQVEELQQTAKQLESTFVYGNRRMEK